MDSQEHSNAFAQIPLPLVQKVNGACSEETFLYIGRCIADSISENVPGLSRTGRILDFGCGMGRVAGRMLPRAPRAEFVCFDIDPRMLKWCATLSDSPRVACVPSTLDQPDASFDLIYAISVFTHLHRTTPFWLSEIRRLLKPAGVAYLTYHDETLFADKVGGPMGEVKILGDASPEGGAAMGTFYRTPAWEAQLAPYFHIRKTVPRGLFGGQSYSVVRRRRWVSAKSRTEAVTEYAKSLERDLFASRSQHESAF